MIDIVAFTAIPIMVLYLDPGTGGLLFSLIAGGISAGYFGIVSSYYKIRDTVVSRFHPGGALGTELIQYVVVSEGDKYFTTFEPILNEFERRSEKVSYYTLDKKDRLLNVSYAHVTAKYIGSSFIGWAYLNNIKAEKVIMTTPGLDVLQVRRSKNVIKYINVVHAPTDKSNTKCYSYDYFDAVILNGPHQEKVLRELEQKRGTRPKQLSICGLAYYDYSVRQIAVSEKENSNTVLIAPTWGKNGLLSRFGSSLVKKVAETGYDVIVRPHPQSTLYEADMLDDIKSDLENVANIRWDYNADNTTALMHSTIMISDFSGIIYDYAFLLEKPVITIKYDIDFSGTEASDLSFTPWDLVMLNRVGKQIEAEEISQIDHVIKDIFNDTTVRESIRSLREEYVVNFGNASQSIVDSIIRM